MTLDASIFLAPAKLFQVSQFSISRSRLTVAHRKSHKQVSRKQDLENERHSQFGGIKKVVFSRKFWHVEGGLIRALPIGLPLQKLAAGQGEALPVGSFVQRKVYLRCATNLSIGPEMARGISPYGHSRK